MTDKRGCSVESCTRPHDAKGMCKTHYLRQAQYGRLHTIRRKKGTGTISNGYVMTCSNGINVFEHILVAEKALGRKLPEDAVIHHVDENRRHNENINLVICPDRDYHNLLHQRMRAFKACGHVDWRKCTHCKKYDDPANLNTNSSTPFHVGCKSEYDRIRRA